MIKNETVYKLLKESPLPFLSYAGNKQIFKTALTFCNLLMDNLSSKEKQYLTDNKLKITCLTRDDLKNKDKFEDLKCLSYVNYHYFTIYLIPPTTPSKTDNCKYVIHTLAHEIGHLVLHKLLTDMVAFKAQKNSIQEHLLTFISSSDAEGGVSEYADKYVKEIYGKKTREQGLHKINDIDIKYHENFAEFYRIYLEHNMDCKYSTKIDLQLDNYKESYKSFLSLLELL